MLASEHGHTKIVERLLEQGAEVNAKDTFGDTALMRADEEAHIQIEKLLKQAGATE